MALTNKVAFKFEQTDDRQINQLQQNLQALAQSVTNSPWANGTQIDTVAFSAGQTQQLNHKLGRAPLGFFPIDVQGSYGAFYRTASDTKTISIRSQNACSAVFWVY